MELKDGMEIKAPRPAETKTATGDPVTDTAGKPIAEPIAMADLAKPAELSDSEKVANLMRELHYSEDAIHGAIETIVVVEKKTTRAKLEAEKEIQTKALRECHAELEKAWETYLQPIFDKAGIKLDLPGKQIIRHVGDAGSPCFDLAYPDPLPDATKKSKGNGGIKVRKAVVMGVVHLRIPELSINMKVAESLSAWYKMWTGHENHGFASATAAVLNIGDGSEGKSGQDGVFNVQNVPAIPETVGTVGSKAYNIVTLNDKGYAFFQIAKGKVQMPTAPVAVAEAPAKAEVAVATAPATPAPVATAPVALSLPENWNKMSKADKKAWRANNGKASS